MNLSSVLDYMIAISGILIIFVSFAWNIYDVFIRKTVHHDSLSSGTEQKASHSQDSAIR